MSPGMPKTSRARPLRAVILGVLGLLALAAAAYAAGHWYVVTRPLPIDADRVEFRVKSGASVRGIAQAARAAGLGVDEWALAGLARASGTSQSLRAGKYAVERGTTLMELLAKLRAGDVMRERITIVEGVTFREMRALLAASPELRHDTAGMSDTDLLKAIGAPEDKASGRPLFPRHLSLRQGHERSRRLAPPTG